MVAILGIVERDVPIAADIRNAYVSFAEMTTSVIAIRTDVIRDGRPVTGYGFNSNGRYAVGGLLRDRFIPRLLRADPAALRDETGTNLDPVKAWEVMMAGEKPGGHGERAVAVGALDMALWDAVAKIEERPLYRVLADRFNGGVHTTEIYVYAAGGYYHPGGNLQALRDELQSYLDQGFDSVKIKVGGVDLGEDLRRIEAAIEVLGGDGSRLAVDANGRFTLTEALRFGEAIAPYGLKWYEEPGDPLDYQLHAVLAESYSGPIATGENLLSTADVRNLVRYGGLRPDRDYLQFDCALSYGFVEYYRTLRMLDQHGWKADRCIPHGGHLMSAHIAAALGLAGNEAYPGVFAPFGGFPDGIQPSKGMVAMPDAPGIGIEQKADLYAVFKDLTP